MAEFLWCFMLSDGEICLYLRQCFRICLYIIHFLGRYVGILLLLSFGTFKLVINLACKSETMATLAS